MVTFKNEYLQSKMPKSTLSVRLIGQRGKEHRKRKSFRHLTVLKALLRLQLETLILTRNIKNGYASYCWASDGYAVNFHAKNKTKRNKADRHKSRAPRNERRADGPTDQRTDRSTEKAAHSGRFATYRNSNGGKEKLREGKSVAT